MNGRLVVTLAGKEFPHGVESRRAVLDRLESSLRWHIDQGWTYDYGDDTSAGLHKLVEINGEVRMLYRRFRVEKLA